MEDNKTYKAFTHLIDIVDKINANPELKKIQEEEYEFMLQDRIAKIQAINEQFNLLDNAYISFSGGKDSVVLSHLIDMALPNNKIPRVYANTGIEYNDMVKYVKSRAKEDDRFIIVNQNKKIHQTLEQYGYPFKSKEFSLRVDQFNKGSNAKFIEKYLNPQTFSKFKCPECLRYIFNERGKYNYSNQCCYKLKKALLHTWQKENNRKMAITGMRNEEGGNRERLSCITNNGKMFHPLIVVSEEWESEFIKRNNIQLCKLYYEPYNFERTGCKGCPYSLQLQKNLEHIYIYMPNEYKQIIHLWKPVYDEYIRIGYRLKEYPHKKGVQLSIDDL